jgi:hypothetical protein
MRLSTIWSIPCMSTMERLRRTREWANMEVASRLPQRLRYWVTMMEIAKATRNSPNIPGTPLDEILKNLQKDYEK